MDVLTPYLPAMQERLNKLGLMDLYAVIGLLMATYLGSWLVKFLHVRWQVRGLPVIHSAIEIFESGARTKFPHIPFVIPVKDFTLDDPWKKYAHAQSDLIACTQLSSPYAVYITSNPSVAACISAKPASVFGKPTGMFRYQAINIYGLQIVSTQTGPEHRRHKNVVKGCFGEAVMQNGFEKMMRAMDTMVREERLENGGKIDVYQPLAVKATLLVIGQAGFDYTIPWDIPETNGPLLPFGEALHVVEHSMIPQLLLPTWLMDYSPIATMRRWGKANRSLLHHIKAMVAAKRSELSSVQSALPKGEKLKPPTDLLGALVASQMDVEAEESLVTGNKGSGLKDSEIIGNIWIFIVAGHETTAHTLCFTMAYLALYPEHQEAIFKELQQVCGGAMPEYRDIPSLHCIFATLYESLRLRDLVMTLPKLAQQDTVLPYTTWTSSGEVIQKTHHVKTGSHIIIDSPACERNPFHWTNPETFDPTRFIRPDGNFTSDGSTSGVDGAENKVVFTGFSIGTRQCIGKRFAEVEMTAFIAFMVKNYTWKPLPKFEGETRESIEKRMLEATEELSFTPSDFGLEFARRA